MWPLYFTCTACGATLRVKGRATARAPAGGAGEALERRQADPVPSTSVYRRAGMAPPTSHTEPLPLPPGVEVLAVFDDSAIGLRLRGRLPDLGPVRLLVTTPAAAAVPGYAEALRRRAASCGGLRHPRLLPLLRLMHAESALVSADAPDHEQLSSLLARRRVLAPHHALALVRQLTEVLEVVTGRGFAHGWLRPESVLVSPSGEVLLDDLCLAKPIGFLLDATRADHHWLAPECVRGAEPDARSDMFGVGALLSLMVMGEPPVRGASTRMALQRVLRDGVPPAQRAGLELSGEFKEFLAGLLASDPDRRPASWAAIRAEIDSFAMPAEGPQFTAPIPRPVPPRTFAPRPARRAPRRDAQAALVVGGAVVLLLAVLGVLLVAHAPSRPAAPATAPVPAADPPPPPVAAAPAGPAAAPAGPAAAPAAEPAPAPDRPANAAALERLERIRAVDNLLVAERFAEALAACAGLPADDRSAREALIHAAHLRQRERVAAQVARARDLPEAIMALRPAQVTWGLPDDAAWAQERLGEARQRLLAAPPPAVPATAPAPAPAPAATAPAPAASAPASRPATAAVPVAPPLSRAAQELLLLGWDSTGGARLEDGGIVLPPTAGGSTISSRIGTGLLGWRCQARGRGVATLRLVGEQGLGEEWRTLALPLPADPARTLAFDVRWDGGEFRILAPDGRVLAREAFPLRPLRFAIEGDDTVVLSPVPLPLRP